MANPPTGRLDVHTPQTRKEDCTLSYWWVNQGENFERASKAHTLWTLQDRRVLPSDLIPRVQQLIDTNKVNERVVEAIEKSSPLGRVLAVGLANRHRPREIMMDRLEDTGRHVVHELERFLNTLGTIAGVAPLLGLLGTVTGIIRAFNAINISGLGDPRVLSGGIAEALVATAGGLAVAIPSLIAYRYLRGRVDRIVVQMEKDAMRLADALDSAERRAELATAQTGGHRAVAAQP